MESLTAISRENNAEVLNTLDHDHMSDPRYSGPNKSLIGTKCGETKPIVNDRKQNSQCSPGGLWDYGSLYLCICQKISKDLKIRVHY